MGGQVDGWTCHGAGSSSAIILSGCAGQELRYAAMAVWSASEQVPTWHIPHIHSVHLCLQFRMDGSRTAGLQQQQQQQKQQRQQVLVQVLHQLQQSQPHAAAHVNYCTHLSLSARQKEGATLREVVKRMRKVMTATVMQVMRMTNWSGVTWTTLKKKKLSRTRSIWL